MKISCEVMSDLLPLYEDGVCTEDSRKLVEAHLTECEKCREKSKQNKSLEFKGGENAKETQADENMESAKGVKKGIQKFKWHMFVKGMCGMLIAAIVITVGILSINEIRGEGICFSEIRERMLVGELVSLLEEQKYEEAVQMLNLEAEYESIQSEYHKTGESIDGKRQIQLLGSNWYVNDKFETELADYVALLSDEQAFWDAVIEEYASCVLIPEEIWAQYYTPEETKELVVTDYNRSYKGKYVYVTTEYGNYYLASETILFDVEGNARYDFPIANYLVGLEDSVASLYYTSLIVPEAIYNVAKADEENEAKHYKEVLESMYGELLTYEKADYVQYRRAELVSYWKAQEKKLNYDALSIIEGAYTIEDGKITIHLCEIVPSAMVVDSEK